jgi:class 3 adenylate cyclase
MKKKSPLIISLTSLSIATKILSITCILIMFLSIFAMVVQYVEDAQSYRYVRAAINLENNIRTVVRENIPTKIGGKDMSGWYIIIGMFLLAGVLSRLSDKTKDRAEYCKFKLNVDQWKDRMNLSDNAIVLTPLNKKLEEIKNAKKKDREQLIKEFVETKKKLDEMGRDLAFLAIDVVDSTGMKQNEERAIVEHDFREYKRFIERCLTAHGCLKTAWTPDGVMSCFNSVDAAVRAAREIITGLDNFNKSVKTMQREFVIRAGVNSGFVYFDDSMPLEEISDRVIDIAGHMQKNAQPNSVSVAKPAIEPLNDRIGFEPSGRIVDGYEVYEWKKS